MLQLGHAGRAMLDLRGAACFALRTRGLVLGLAVVASLLLPAGSQADILAAYDHATTTGQLDIGLVNASTGKPVPVPAGVNTTAQEFHPTLSPDRDAAGVRAPDVRKARERSDPPSGQPHPRRQLADRR